MIIKDDGILLLYNEDLMDGEDEAVPILIEDQEEIGQHVMAEVLAGKFVNELSAKHSNILELLYADTRLADAAETKLYEEIVKLIDSNMERISAQIILDIVIPELIEKGALK